MMPRLTSPLLRRQRTNQKMANEPKFEPTDMISKFPFNCLTSYVFIMSVYQCSLLWHLFTATNSSAVRSRISIICAFCQHTVQVNVLVKLMHIHATNTVFISAWSSSSPFSRMRPSVACLLLRKEAVRNGGSYCIWFWTS
jgi:hypothetical protein